MYEGVSQSSGSGSRSVPVRLPPPHSPLVGRVVNLEGARLQKRRPNNRQVVEDTSEEEAGVLGYCTKGLKRVLT